MEPEGSLSHLEPPATCPYLEPIQIRGLVKCFVNTVSLYGESC